MKQSNRELMERAIGIIEGVSFCVGEKVQDALACAVDMIEKAMNDEEKEEETKK